MKMLNELTPKERLELYKKALVDWTERPNDKQASTHRGLCGYFSKIHFVQCVFTYQVIECHEWVNHVDSKVEESILGYIGELGDPIPRIAALNAMIKELEDADGQ